MLVLLKGDRQGQTHHNQHFLLLLQRKKHLCCSELDGALFSFHFLLMDTVFYFTVGIFFLFYNWDSNSIFHFDAFTKKDSNCLLFSLSVILRSHSMPFFQVLIKECFQINNFVLSTEVYWRRGRLEQDEGEELFLRWESSQAYVISLRRIRKKQVGRSLQLWVADSRGCAQPDMFQIFWHGHASNRNLYGF